jgi:PAS domain S-box-containing protein
MEKSNNGYIIDELSPTHIINSLSNGIIVTDASCRMIFLNGQAAETLSLDKENTIGLHISEILPSAEFFFKRCIKTFKPQFGIKIVTEKGYIAGNITAILKGKKIKGVVCSLSGTDGLDITSNKLESYKCLNKELEAIFNSSSDGSWLCSGDGTVLKLNKAAEQLNAIKEREIIGKKAWYLAEKGIVEKSVTREVVEKRHTVTEIQHIKKTNKDLMVTSTPVFDQDGNIFRIVVNEKDITGLNAVRKELERSRLVTEKFRDKLSELSMMELKNQQIVAESEDMKQVLRIALKLARTGASDILILGESGVGKGLLAKFIHKNSSRRKNSFIQISCASLPESLLEAELFGYERGAFTGAANEGKIGLIELAQNGTLFLDEIGDIPLSMQVKLLNYLDNHLVRALGGVKSKTINCAIIAATNRDLEVLIKQGKFREDLFYRLNTFTIRIPSLRERKEDIFELTNFFMQKYNETYKLKRRISGRLMETLLSYPFPGNVRELDSIFKQAVVMSDNDVLDKFMLARLRGGPKKLKELSEGKYGLINRVREFERDLLESALLECKTTREMADSLGINQSTVVRKLKKYDLSGPSMQGSIE